MFTTTVSVCHLGGRDAWGADGWDLEPQMSRMDADDFGELGGAAMIEGAAGGGW